MLVCRGKPRPRLHYALDALQSNLHLLAMSSDSKTPQAHKMHMQTHGHNKQTHLLDFSKCGKESRKIKTLVRRTVKSKNTFI